MQYVTFVVEIQACSIAESFGSEIFLTQLNNISVVAH